MKKLMIVLASWMMFACGNDAKKEIQQAKMMAIDSMKMQAKIKEVRQHTIDSMRILAQNQANEDFTNNSTSGEVKKIGYEEVRKFSSSNVEGYIPKKTNEDLYSAPSSPPVYKPVKKKRKISRPVQGAIIGAGVGAVSGAIINKSNRGKGAVIGGILGAGVGAGTGVIIDNNEKKKGNINFF